MGVRDSSRLVDVLVDVLVETCSLKNSCAWTHCFEALVWVDSRHEENELEEEGLRESSTRE